MSRVNSTPFPNVIEQPGQSGHATLPSFNLQAIKASIVESIKDTFAKLPLLTLGILTLCCSLQLIASFLFLLNALGVETPTLWRIFGPYYFSLYPLQIIKHYQVWRLLTYPYFHADWLHLLFNMLAVIPLSRSIEKRLGTVQYFVTLNLVFVLVPSILYTLLSLIPMALFSNLGPAIGLSGVFFSLLVWECFEYPISNFCGLFDINPKTYPLILFTVISLLFPNASFLGHFLGLWIGYLYAYNLFKWLDLRADLILRLENTQPILYLSKVFRARFQSYEGSSSSIRGPILPLFFSQNSSNGSTWGPTNNGAYHTPLFQNVENNPSTPSNIPDSRFQGTGQRLGD